MESAEPTELSAETDTFSPVKSTSEDSLRVSSSVADVAFTHSHNNHVIEGIKCFMGMSRMLKAKERENALLRDKNDALTAENDLLSKKVEAQQANIEKQKHLEPEIEDLKFRLKEKDEEFVRGRKTYSDNLETMQARLEEFEFQKITTETEAAHFDKEEVQTKMKNAEEMVAKLTSTVKKLEEKSRSDNCYIQKLEQDTLEIIALRKQIKSLTVVKNISSEMIDTPTCSREGSPSSNKNTKSVENNNRVEVAIKNLIEIMDGHSQNRRISTLPPSIQLEPPVVYLSSETFIRITELLKSILIGKKITPRSVQTFWDYLIQRANIVEEAIKEKAGEIRRLAGDELIRLEEAHEKQKKEFIRKLSSAEELAKKYVDEHKLEISDKNEKINALYRENRNLIDEIAEYKTALNASSKASKNEEAEIQTKICVPSTIQCTHEDYRQQLEDLKVSSSKIVKDLKQKLILVEQKQYLEQQKNRFNVPHATKWQSNTKMDVEQQRNRSNVSPPLKLQSKTEMSSEQQKPLLKVSPKPKLKTNTKPLAEATQLKVDTKPNWFNPRVYKYANAVNGVVEGKSEDQLANNGARDDEEDKDWLMTRFFKADSNDS